MYCANVIQIAIQAGKGLRPFFRAWLTSVLVTLCCAAGNAYQDYDLSTLSSSQGFTMTSGGSAVSSAGDVNGDGTDDVIIGAFWASTNTGVVYVIFGHKDEGLSNFNLPTFVTGPTTGFRIFAAESGDRNGYSVSKAGDVNGDGIDDVITGALHADPTGGRVNAGIVYVIFGRKVTSPANAFDDIQLTTTALNADVGFRILGATAGDNVGFSVKTAGDVNGDGISDIIVGAWAADPPSFPPNSDAGIAYVIFGRNMSDISVLTFGDIDLTDAVTNTTLGFRVLGAAVNDQLGTSVSGAGDVNGDGISDIVIGAPRADPPGLAGDSNGGITYVIFGRAATLEDNPFSDIQLPTTTMASSVGFRILGAIVDDRSGFTVGAAGDINGDGSDDVIVGAYFALSSTGIAYVIFGRNVPGGATPFTDILLSSITSGSTVGFRILGAAVGDDLGYALAVSPPGDVNDDGIDDILVGARNADPTAGKVNAGISYVIYGRKSVAGSVVFNDINAASITASAQNGYFILGAVGGDASGRAVSGAGDLNGDGVNDVIIGTPLGSSYVIYGTPGTPTSQPSSQPSRQPSRQPRSQPSGQPSSQPSAQPSRQPTRQPSVQPSGQPSRQPSRQPTMQPSTQPRTQPSTYPSRQPSAQPTTQPSMQPSTQPTQLPSRQPSSQPSVQPSIRPSTQPSSQPTRQPSGQPTKQPTHQPQGQPSAQPSMQPSLQPKSQPSTNPSAQPSVVPSSQPSQQPSTQPSGRPTKQPTIQPSSQPLQQPSVQPSSVPTDQPTGQPSSQPSAQPSCTPIGQPSTQPSTQPSSVPSVQPSTQPSGHPSGQPSAQPSTQPSSLPSGQPSSQPSTVPTVQPSMLPSVQPSSLPSAQPSEQPIAQPTAPPTNIPSAQLTCGPSVQPSSQPTTLPSGQPSTVPTTQAITIPTSQPSLQPSNTPSTQPSTRPSGSLSSQPSSQPSVQPSLQPSEQPRAVPTRQPSVSPTANPTTDPYLGTWVTMLSQVQDIDTIAIVDDDVWACGSQNASATCAVISAKRGNIETEYDFLWSNVISVLQTGDVSRVTLSGRTTPLVGASTSELATCAVESTSLVCTIKSFYDTYATSLTYVPYTKKMLLFGVQNVYLSLSIVPSGTGVVRSCLYSSPLVKTLVISHAKSPPNFVGAFIAGTAVSTAGAFNVIIAGMVRTDSGTIAAMSITPVSWTILNSAELVNAMALEHIHPDSFIVGGLQLNDGVGMHAYLVRVNALLGVVKYGVRYRPVLDTTGSVNEESRRMLSDTTVLCSVTRGIVRVDSAIYMTVDLIHTTQSTSTSLTILKIDTETGLILQQAHVSSPTASISCNDITSSKDGLFLYMSCQITQMNALTESVVISVDSDLEFPRLPIGFYGNDAVIFTAERVPFKKTTLPVVMQNTPSLIVDSEFATAEKTPTALPSVLPTKRPTVQPSSVPSGQPSSSPTAAPSVSLQPTSQPSTSGPTNTYKPTVRPTLPPTTAPSRNPSFRPSVKPTIGSTLQPSITTTSCPTTQPSTARTTGPTRAPSRSTTLPASLAPSVAPSVVVDGDVAEENNRKKSDNALVIGGSVIGALLALWCGNWLLKCLIYLLQVHKKRKARREIMLASIDTINQEQQRIVRDTVRKRTAAVTGARTNQLPTVRETDPVRGALINSTTVRTNRFPTGAYVTGRIDVPASGLTLPTTGAYAEGIVTGSQPANEEERSSVSSASIILSSLHSSERSDVSYSTHSGEAYHHNTSTSSSSFHRVKSVENVMEEGAIYSADHSSSVMSSESGYESSVISSASGIISEYSTGSA